MHIFGYFLGYFLNQSIWAAYPEELQDIGDTGK